MKGIIFNLAEEVVTAAHGADAWDTILDKAGLDGSYTSLGSYPDEDLFAIVGAAADLLKADQGTVVRFIAEGAIPLLAARYPEFFDPHPGVREFVLTLNDIIHPEVRKLYPGAEVPQFEFDTSDANVLLVGYRSPRKLCSLAEGFIIGAARHYGQVAELTQTACMHEGAPSCLIECRFGDGA